MNAALAHLDRLQSETEDAINTLTSLRARLSLPEEVVAVQGSACVNVADDGAQSHFKAAGIALQRQVATGLLQTYGAQVL